MWNRLKDLGYSIIQTIASTGEAIGETIETVGGSAQQQAASNFVGINDNPIDYNKSLKTLGNATTTVANAVAEEVVDKGSTLVGGVAQVGAIAAALSTAGATKEVTKHVINTINDTSKAVCNNVTKVSENATITNNTDTPFIPIDQIDTKSPAPPEKSNTPTESIQPETLKQETMNKTPTLQPSTTDTPNTQTPTIEPTTQTGITDVPTFDKYYNYFFGSTNNKEPNNKNQNNMNSDEDTRQFIYNEGQRVPGANPEYDMYTKAANQMQSLLKTFASGALGLMTNSPSAAYAMSEFLRLSEKKDNNQVAEAFVQQTAPRLMQSIVRERTVVNPYQHINQVLSQTIEQDTNPLVSDIFGSGLHQEDQVSLIQNDVNNYNLYNQAPFPI